MRKLMIPFDKSLAGKTKHNSLAERSNQFLLVATTTCMLEAGIPPCFWPYAIRCVSHLLNIEPNDTEVSAWCKLHGKEFEGKMIPFGALIIFKPSGTIDRIDQNHKFDPDRIPGVFAGYDLGPGLKWSGKYRAWALSDWIKQSLAYDASRPIGKLRVPHYTERVELKEPLEFPCKANYEKINVTIEGLKIKDQLSGDPIHEPIDDQNDNDDDDDGDDRPGRDAPARIEEKEREDGKVEDSVTQSGQLPEPPGLERIESG